MGRKKKSKNSHWLVVEKNRIGRIDTIRKYFTVGIRLLHFIVAFLLAGRLHFMIFYRRILAWILHFKKKKKRQRERKEKEFCYMDNELERFWYFPDKWEELLRVVLKKAFSALCSSPWKNLQQNFIFNMLRVWIEIHSLNTFMFIP